MSEYDDIQSQLKAWAGFVSSGYEVPAAGGTMSAAEAANARAERLREALSDAVAWMNGCAVSGGYPAWHAKALRTLEDDRQ